MTPHYTAWKQITDDIDDVRVSGGIPFRYDQEAGARQGWQVGSFILETRLLPLSLHGMSHLGPCTVMPFLGWLQRLMLGKCGALTQHQTSFLDDFAFACDCDYAPV